MKTKPEKPKKRITVRNSATFNFEWVSKKVSLDHFLDWCKQSVPNKAKDVTLELVEEWMYDDCSAYLQLEWDEVVDDPSYEREIKKYERKLRKWERENESHRKN